MEYTGRCVAVSEPNSLSILEEKYLKFGDSLELRQLARDIIRWECRPYPTMQPPPLGYFLKLMRYATVTLPMFRQRLHSATVLLPECYLIRVLNLQVSRMFPAISRGLITSRLVSAFVMCQLKITRATAVKRDSERAFSNFVNAKNVRDESRIASGRLFQVRGPATANDLSPNEVCIRGTWNFPLSADLIPRRRWPLGSQKSRKVKR